MSKVKPIRPDEVPTTNQLIPSTVIEVFNELIATRFDPENGRAIVKQNDVLALLYSRDYSREEIFKNNWLDVEGLYRAEGWEVEYDKPGYNEDYGAFFVFRRPK